MISRNNIAGIMVTLLIDGKQSLFIMLSSDGTINRLGTGSVENTEQSMYLGQTSTELFRQLSEKISDDLLSWCGQALSAPEQRGKTCELSVGFKMQNGEELVTDWKYGSESQGPPPAVCEFVLAAIDGTTQWYDEQKTIAERGKINANKKWWQFWK